MSWKRTLLALLALAALLLGAWYLEGWREDRRFERREREQIVFDWEPEQTRAFRLENPHGTFRLERQDTEAEGRGRGWVLVEPVHTPANPHVVAALLHQIRALRRLEILEGGSPRAFGLDGGEALALEAEGPGRRTVRVSIGREVPTRPLVYARQGEDPVFLTPREARLSVNLDLGQLRDLQLVSFEVGEVDRILWERSGDREPLEILRNRGEGPEWRLQEPENVPADPATVEEEAYRLKGLFARRVAAELSDIRNDPTLLSELGLDPPRTRVLLETRDGERLEADFGELAPDNGGAEQAGSDPEGETKEEGPSFLVFARGPAGAVFVVDGTILRKVNGPWVDWMDRRLARVDRWGLQRVRMRAAAEDEEYILVRQEDRLWTSPQAPGRDLDWDQVDPLLDVLILPRIEAYLSDRDPEDPALGFDQGVLRVELEDTRGETGYVVGNRSPNPAYRYVLIDGVDVGLVRYGVSVNALRRMREFFRDAPPPAESPREGRGTGRP